MFGKREGFAKLMHVWAEVCFTSVKSELWGPTHVDFMASWIPSFKCRSWNDAVFYKWFSCTSLFTWFFNCSGISWTADLSWISCISSFVWRCSLEFHEFYIFKNFMDFFIFMDVDFREFHKYHNVHGFASRFVWTWSCSGNSWMSLYLWTCMDLMLFLISMDFGYVSENSCNSPFPYISWNSSSRGL